MSSGRCSVVARRPEASTVVVRASVVEEVFMESPFAFVRVPAVAVSTTGDKYYEDRAAS